MGSEPRPGGQCLFAVGGEGAGVRSGAWDRALVVGPTGSCARSGIGDNRRGASNNVHREAVELAAKAGKAILCTKPLGRTATEALKMLRAVEKAGVFAGYLEDLVYTPKTLKALASTRKGAMGRILWTRSGETHSGPHSAWFWDPEQSGGGAIIDMGCHCIEIGRNFIGKDKRPLRVFCWGATQVHPIEAETTPSDSSSTRGARSASSK